MADEMANEMADEMARTLAGLWRAALARPMHSPACGCAVPSAVHLDPLTLELDLLDYVEHKHGLAALPAWRAALQQRQSGRTGTLAEWLAQPARTGLDDALHAQVVADIAASLASMATHAAGRLAPAGTLAPGWLGGRGG